MNYRITIDVTVSELLDRATQEMLRSAISAIITDNLEEADVGDIRFGLYNQFATVV
jgi:hypothetical protein